MSSLFTVEVPYSTADEWKTLLFSQVDTTSINEAQGLLLAGISYNALKATCTSVMTTVQTVVNRVLSETNQRISDLETCNAAANVQTQQLVATLNTAVAMQ